MKLTWRNGGKFDGVARHYATCQGLRATIVDYYGESQSFLIEKVTSVTSTRTSSIIVADIDTRGMANTKQEVAEYMSFLIKGVPLPERLLKSSKITYYPDNVTITHKAAVHMVRGFPIGGIYHCPDKKHFYELVEIINTARQMHEGAKPSLIFQDIVDDSRHCIDIMTFNKLKLSLVR